MYKIKDILYAAELCRKVALYKPTKVLCKKKQQKDSEYYINVLESEVLILKKGKDVYVIFNKTEFNIIDIFCHLLTFSKKITCIGKVHRGYFGKLQLVYTKIVDLLDMLTYNNLYVIGHSLGGALAQLFALQCKTRKHLQCITFGSCNPIKKLYSDVKLPVIQNFYTTKDYMQTYPKGYISAGAKYIIPADDSPIIMSNKKTKGTMFYKLKVLASIFIYNQHAIGVYIKKLKKRL